MFNDVQQAIDWIIKRRKSKHQFSSFLDYVQAIGNPQNKLKTLHVGGTNGKGSTVNYLRNILQMADYKVGTFTSPHLVSHLDRIRINNENISDEYFLDKVNENYQIWQEHDLTMFEIDMLIAIDYFIDNNVDYGIFEVGLGGRLDATNIINPIVSIITNIDLDHTQILGNTIEEIALEKAGIIKENSLVITAEKKKSALEVFKKVCVSKNSKLIVAPEASETAEEAGCSFVYKNQKYFISSPANYQINNAILAIETVKQLQKQYFNNVNEEIISKGLLTFWPGRFETISEEPKIIIDGAHNLAGIEALTNSLNKDEDYIFVFSALKDKNYAEMIKKLTLKGEVIVTEFESDRKVKALELAKNQDVLLCFDYLTAIKYALTKNKTLIITGSLYFISIVRNSFVK